MMKGSVHQCTDFLLVVQFLDEKIQTKNSRAFDNSQCHVRFDTFIFRLFQMIDCLRTGIKMNDTDSRMTQAWNRSVVHILKQTTK